MNVANELRKMGFDVKPWMPPVTRNPWMQITDSTGITFYMLESATLDECLARHKQKQDEFKLADKHNAF